MKIMQTSSTSFGVVLFCKSVMNYSVAQLTLMHSFRCCLLCSKIWPTTSASPRK